MSRCPQCGHRLAQKRPMIRQIRRLKDMTQAELGMAIGRNPSWVSTLEAGHSTANAEILQKIADALGVEVAELEEPDE